jgi:integrase
MGKSAPRVKTKYEGVYTRNGNVYIVYWNGAKHVERRFFGSVEDAYEERLKREVLVHRGRIGVTEQAENTTFAEFLEIFERQQGLKSYIKLYRDRYLDAFGSRRLCEIGRTEIFDFRQKMLTTPRQRGGEPVRKTTVNRALAGLRTLINTAFDMGYLETSPWTRKMLFPEARKGLKRHFEEEQMLALLKEADALVTKTFRHRPPRTERKYPPFMRDVIEVAFLSGMRDGESELLGLQWDWIDFDRKIIVLPRTKTYREEQEQDTDPPHIDMQDRLVEILMNLPRRSKYVFCQEDGSPLRLWHIQRPFKAMVKAIGLDPRKYSLKELRHTTGTIMYEKGADPVDIQRHLRHSQLSTTINFYVGQASQRQKKTVELLVLQPGHQGLQADSEIKPQNPAQVGSSLEEMTFSEKSRLPSA